MKVLFYGDKSLGNGILKTLQESDNVVGVITNPPGEGYWYPKIKSVPISDEPDWIVCAYYDKILTDKEIEAAKFGAINVHLGLVQDYRGCYPTTFPIIDGKSIAGATIHEMTSLIDGGKVYAQAKVSVDSSDTGKTLYYKCTGAAIDLFKKEWPSIKSGEKRPLKITVTPRYHKRSEFPNHEIKLSWNRSKIDRYVRALTFPPFPRPYFVIDGKKFEIYYP